MRLKQPDGHVDASRASDDDQTTSVSWCFFFTCDVEKSPRFMFDRIDMT